MVKESTRSLWRDVSVGWKLASIPALFIAAIGGMLLYTLSTIDDQTMDGLVIDVAGRQRTLCQRFFSEVLLATQGQDSDFEGTQSLLEESVSALLNGGPVTIYSNETRTTKDLPPAPTAAVVAALNDEKAALKALFAKAGRVLKVRSDDPAYVSLVNELAVLRDNADVEANTTVKLFTDHSRSKIAGMMRWETFLGICVAGLGIAFSWLVSRGISGPLAEVVHRAKHIAEGDLRGQKLANASTDEVGQLAVVFNQMLDGLRDLAGQTMSVTGNLNAAASEILASTQQQAAGTKQQAATTQQITSTMEELRQSGGQITEKARQVATSAEETAASSTSGLEAVKHANRAMEAIRQQVEEVAENIVALSEKTLAVGEIISTVNDIAERSNLLALNAAIEAAAAGEQGNRFSVVANEIKNLAEQAKESTVQVRSILGDIQKGINSSVMLTEEAVKRVEQGKQQADVTEQTILEMAEAIQGNVQAFQQIIGATGQQQIGFEQVTQGMRDILQAATQTAAGTVQLEKAVASLNAQSQQLTSAVGAYRI